MESIQESIEVLAHFQKNKIKPLRFLWRHTSYSISNITTQYQSKNGGVVSHIFAVQSGLNLYELSYQPANYTWQLRSVTSL